MNLSEADVSRIAEMIATKLSATNPGVLVSRELCNDRVTGIRKTLDRYYRALVTVALLAVAQLLALY